MHFFLIIKLVQGKHFLTHDFSKYDELFRIHDYLFKCVNIVLKYMVNIC